MAHTLSAYNRQGGNTMTCKIPSCLALLYTKEEWVMPPRHEENWSPDELLFTVLLSWGLFWLSWQCLSTVWLSLGCDIFWSNLQTFPPSPENMSSIREYIPEHPDPQGHIPKSWVSMGEDNESLRHKGRYVVVRDTLVYVPAVGRRRCAK